MNMETVIISGIEIEVYSLNTVVVGSGAAGFNAADSLYSLGQKDIAIVTEGMNKGTSRNTGSDKQTYYKLTLEGGVPDSVADMAKTFFDGGAMHGDIALVEAALSAKCFFKLTEIGVPFPHNRYGEYAGYKTDHDPRKRATSAGPLTSKFMTEKLEMRVKEKGIIIFDGFMVIGILTDNIKSENVTRNAIGLIAINLKKSGNTNMGFTLFNCTNIVYATGGPAGMYSKSVYPESHTGFSGIAFEAGVKGVNLTESQYGIASVKFRWNLSGTYQQVIPRYVSTGHDGTDEREFLDEYFNNTGEMLNAIFLKGYQWPFDSSKVENNGSSLIDILVYSETEIKGRKVYIDFTKNPSNADKKGHLDFSLLGGEAFTYLKNSNALLSTPIERLKIMNPPAIDLYLKNGIDLNKEYLEIAVCAQHNNGGLMGNIWWESNLRHFFPVGEVCGNFGIYRPGGSALNSTQVGSLRAAQFICANYTDSPLAVKEFLDAGKNKILDKIEIASILAKPQNRFSNIFEQRRKMQSRMSKAGAHIRSLELVASAISECEYDLANFCRDTAIQSAVEIPEAFKNRDILITQFVYLNAIKDYIENGGKSRGSYLVSDMNGILPCKMLCDDFRFLPDDGILKTRVCETKLILENGKIKCSSSWADVRSIPCEENWFENVWSEFRELSIGDLYHIN